MAPESNTAEPDDTDDQIDVVSLEEVDQSELSPAKYTEDVPIESVEEDVTSPQEELTSQQEAIPSPKQQERRLEDVCRVRDEAQSLRQEICKLRSRLEEVEEESKFHAAKANELTELLMNGKSCKGNSGIDDTILAQSNELAKRARRIERLEKTVTKLTTEKSMLEIERDNAKKETAELSVVVRSLQNVTTSSIDKNKSYSDADDDDDDDDDESEASEEVVLTPETALDLTLSNLKEHIEMLEDGLQTSSTLNSTQKREIAALEMDNLLQKTKIGLLEELFRELNAHRLYEKERERERERANKDTSEKKTSGINESNKEESNKKESDSDSDSTSGKSDTSAKSGKSSKTSSAGFAERFRSIRTGTLAGLTAAMDKTGLAAALEPKEHKPEIPAAATAAAHAAALIVGKEEQPTGESANGDVSSPKPKEQKTKMKKVKIKFKKAGLEGTYTGPLVNKKPHGVGTIRFTNGDTYLGEMTRGKMSGTGTLYTKNKGVFRGQFENNKFIGELESSDGDSDGSGADPTHAGSKDDATATTAATEDDETAKANAVAALELDGFSPTTITGNKDIIVGIDDSFRSHPPDRDENESFLKEFSGSERSSTPDEDASLSSQSDVAGAIAGANQPFQQTVF